MNHHFAIIEPLYQELSEIAGYLWERGWAELNAGNISIRLANVSEHTFQDLAISETFSLPAPIPALANEFVLITGTGRRMRQIAKQPKEHTMIVSVHSNATTYHIYYTSFGQQIKPTSELPTHLACHGVLKTNKPNYNTILHTHPSDLISFSHHPDMNNEELINKTLWKMHPETVVFAPTGMGFIPYQIPGNTVIANATIAKLATKNTILWQKHGAFAVGTSITQAFDVIDVLNKSAAMYLQCKAAGFEPTGLTEAEMSELMEVYKDFGK
jgi:rhamnulose-1-phosphate aldolase